MVVHADVVSGKAEFFYQVGRLPKIGGACDFKDRLQ